MLELTGFGSVLRGIGFLYWALAIGAVVLAVRKGTGMRGKVLWTAIAVAVFGFLPGKAMVENYRHNAYATEAWAYFKKKCDTEAGEKIYKTFTGVKSVLIVKPLPPATEKDNYDQFWYGDPYSDATPSQKRGEYAAISLVTDWKHRSGQGSQRGLDYIEMKQVADNRFIRIYRPESDRVQSVREPIESPNSKYGAIWEDISTPDDRKFWVAASRFRIVDLANNGVIAERIGFLIEAGFGSTVGQRRPWLTARGVGPNGRSCPDAHDATDQWFITSVFKQDEGK